MNTPCTPAFGTRAPATPGHGVYTACVRGVRVQGSARAALITARRAVACAMCAECAHALCLCAAFFFFLLAEMIKWWSGLLLRWRLFNDCRHLVAVCQPAKAMNGLRCSHPVHVAATSVNNQREIHCGGVYSLIMACTTSRFVNQLKQSTVAPSGCGNHQLQYQKKKNSPNYEQKEAARRAVF